jgi:hypothetical protein
MHSSHHDETNQRRTPLQPPSWPADMAAGDQKRPLQANNVQALLKFCHAKNHQFNPIPKTPGTLKSHWKNR